MNLMKTINIAVGVGAYIALASLAPPAQASDADNPYLPKPAASTATPGNGHDTYCVKGRMIPGWTCDQELSANGGTGTTGPALSPTPPSKPDCENGPKA